MNIKAHAKLILAALFIILFISLGVIAYALKTPTKEIIYLNSDYDRAFAEKFKNDYQKYYNTLDYQKVEGDSISFTLDTLKEAMAIYGYEVNNTKFAIHIMGCSENDGYCGFRINGIPTGAFRSSFDKKEYRFSLGNGYAIRIDNILFDYCGQTFCDYELDLYSIINISIIKE